MILPHHLDVGARRAAAWVRRAGAWASRRRLLAGPLALVGLSLLAGSFLFGLAGTTSATPNKTSTDPHVLREGENLFNQACASCHGTAGVGTNRAPSLVFAGPAAADFYLETGRMPLNDPHDQALRKPRDFTQSQIAAIVSYVNQFPKIHGKTGKGPQIPKVLPLCSGGKSSDSGNIAAEQAKGTAKCVTLSFGQHTFALNCASCHQIAGSGGMLSKGNVIPSLKNASLLITAEAMRIGPRPMPIFGPGQLNDVQMSAVAHYVDYLRAPDHPGGLTISGFGPVAEGFVGILVGLGLMLIVARLMGTRG